jgi:hypothetical protein
MTKKKDQSSNADTALYQARDRVIDEMPKIIDAIIKKALDGSYQHAKFLLDFAGSEPAAQAAGGDEESLAAMLIKELREGTPPESA